MENDKSTQTPIAVIGLACRLPGSCNNPDEFWELLENDRVAALKPPETRFALHGHYDGSARPGTMVSPGAMFIDADPRDIDAQFFSLSRSDAIAMDPQQRQLLEVVYESLENAGIPLQKLSGKAYGCFVGSYANDYGDMQARDPEDRVPLATTGLGRAMLSNRVSHFLNIKGTSMTVDTACSGSLVSLDIACRYLHLRDIEGAIVAGCNLFLSPEHNTDLMAMQGASTKSGRCHVFDAKADGYIKSEAVNAIVLKRLDNAIADGDPIRAIIRGTSSNSDGWTPGIASPSSSAQASAIRKAYANADISDLTLTGYLEAHGTGTQAGDPIEASGVSSVFAPSRSADNPLLIGSVKSNIGHSEPASGLSGFLKAVLSLERGMIPGNPTFITPSPQIDFKQLKLRVVEALTPWPRLTAQRASVNSFGYGGSNAHAVLESAQSFLTTIKSPHSKSLRPFGKDIFATVPPVTQPYLLPFSGNSKSSLNANISALQKHLVNPTTQVNLRDVAYTLTSRRSHHFFRAFTVLQDYNFPKRDIVYGQRNTAAQGIGLVFTGQGSQWSQMGKDILRYFKCARLLIERLQKSLNALPSPPQWSLIEELTQPRDSARLRLPEYSQPLVTAVQLCQVEILQSWGVTYHSVVGHSSGEIAAASAAGYLSPEEAIMVAYLRGIAAKSQPSQLKSGMLAVGVAFPLLEELLSSFNGRLQVACYNSPESFTVSGPVEDLTTLKGVLNVKGAFARLLQVDLAYHSSYMTPVAEAYERLLEPLGLTGSHTEKNISMVSSVSGDTLSQPYDATYWRLNMTQPVLFEQALKTMVFSGANFLIEVGPTGALAGPIAQVKKSISSSSHSFDYHAIAKRDADCLRTLYHVAGHIYLNDGEIKTENVNLESTSELPTTVIDLPNYMWDHSVKYWHESEASKDWRFRRFPIHDLLGSKILGTPWEAPWFRKSLKVQDLPWLRDHKISDAIVFPAAGYVSMAIEALRQIGDAKGLSRVEEGGRELYGYNLRDVAFIRPLLLQDDGEANKLVLSMVPTSEAIAPPYRFKIFSSNNGEWIQHCRGAIQMAKSPGQACSHDLRVPPNLATPGKLWYKAMADAGYHFGPAFQKQTSIQCAEGQPESCSIIDLSYPQSSEKQSWYPLHPTCMDGCFQAAAPSLWLGRKSEVQAVLVPMSIDTLTICITSGLNHHGIAYSSRQYSGICDPQRPESYTSNVTVYEQSSGSLLLHMSGLSYGVLESSERSLNRIQIAQEVWKPDVSFLNATHSLRNIEASMSHRGHLEHYTNEENTQGVTKTSSAYYGNASITAQLDRVISLLLHKKPDLRVLEVQMPGILSKSAWLDVEDSVKRHTVIAGLTLMSSDTSSLVETQSRYADIPGIRYIQQDMTRPINENGPRDHAFDLILLNLDLLYCEDLEQVLHNCQSLLSEESHLILLDHDRSNSEIAPPSSLKVVYEVFADSVTRPNLPQKLDTESEKIYIALGQYVDSILRMFCKDGTGFKPVLPLDFGSLSLPSLRFVGLSPELRMRPGDTVPLSVKVIQYREDVQIPAALTNLASRGWEMSVARVEMIDTQDESLLLVVDETSSHVSPDISEPQWEKLKTLLTSGKRILWITKGAFFGQHPENALVYGLARSARAEDPTLQLKLLDLKNGIDENTVPLIAWVLEHFTESSENELLEVNGVLHIGRIAATETFRPYLEPAPKELQLRDSQQLLRLQCEQLGTIDSLKYFEVPEETGNLLPDSFVEIDILAAGLNFKDVAVVMGFVPEDHRLLGLEGAGTIRQVGKKAGHYAVGDRVLTYRKGTFSNRVQAPVERVHHLPNDLSFEEAATLACVYGVSIYGLCDLANLKKGDKVLIHSAAGGVGIAAIHLCRHAGAEIFATVSNDEKKAFLERTFNIPTSHIFSSRSVAFSNSIMNITNGSGCDIILNSLTGELLDESWRCVASNGTMIEIGKRDILDRNSLSMEPFRRNASFRAVDMSHPSLSDSIISGLLKRIFQLLSQGHIKPITPVKTFSFSEIPSAIRYMGTGQHVGKIVISDESHAKINILAQPARKVLALRKDVSYLIVGGLKGLCGSLAVFLTRCGARHLVILSRSGYRDDRSQAVLADLRSVECRVDLVEGDVSNLKDVQSAFQAATAPIDGIIHGAMVLRDKTLPSMSAEDFHAATRAKVKGTQNLHQVSQAAGRSLSFFTLLSSISGVIGQPGQANYAAANVFLDSFAAYRHSLGLAACSVDLGVIEDVGYIAEHQEIAARLNTGTWATGTNEAKLHRIVELAILQQQQQQQQQQHQLEEQSQRARAEEIVENAAANLAHPPPLRGTLGSPLSFPQLITGIGMPQPPSSELLRDPRFRTLYHTSGSDHLGHASSSSSSKNSSNSNGASEQARQVHSLLQLARSHGASSSSSSAADRASALLQPTIALVGAHLARSLAMSQPIEPAKPLSSYGLDSLAAVELRNWLRLDLGVEVSTLEITGARTLATLCGSVAERIG